MLHQWVKFQQKQTVIPCCQEQCQKKKKISTSLNKKTVKTSSNVLLRPPNFMCIITFLIYCVFVIYLTILCLLSHVCLAFSNVYALMRINKVYI